MMMNVCVLGTGYVGLVTGACLAEIGHDVTCVDSDVDKLAVLTHGDIPIFEPGLQKIVQMNAEMGRLRFSDDLRSALEAEELVLFVAVGTPTAPDGSADLSALFNAVATVARQRSARCPQGFMILVVKSTVPVGTCKRVQAVLSSHLPGSQFAVVSNPEFLREGCAVQDFMHPDRIVVGCTSPRALMAMRRLYAPLIGRGHCLVETDAVETSELIKYASNVFLATKIGLINEFARLCEAVGADVVELSRAIGLDHRIGVHCLVAGPGFGGSCFPKDLRALVDLASKQERPMPIAEAVIASNAEHKRIMAMKICGALDGDVQGMRIAILGLSFKAGTDDIREAPAIDLIATLLDLGAILSAYDPHANTPAARLFPEVDYAACVEDAVSEVDAIVIMTEWAEFRDLDWEHLASVVSQPLVIDLRNHLDPERLASCGFDYVGVGRPKFNNAAYDPVPFLAISKGQSSSPSAA